MISSQFVPRATRASFPGMESWEELSAVDRYHMTDFVAEKVKSTAS